MESKDELHQVDSVQFDIYDPATVRRISALQITEPVAYDNLNTPIKGGLHDPNLGVSAYDKFSPCSYCGQDSDNCPGHFGHIDLAAPVYNPFHCKTIHRLLNTKCFNCDKLKMRNKEKSYIFLKFLLIKLGLLKEASSLQSIFYSSTIQTTSEIERKVMNFINTIFENYEVKEEIRKGSIDTTHTAKTQPSATEEKHNKKNYNEDQDEEKKDKKDKKKKKKEENKDQIEEVKKLKEDLVRVTKEANINSLNNILKNIKRLGKKNEMGDQNLNIQIQEKYIKS
jgi:DNA-directed RNA polymerase I subunit RPA1